MTDRSPLMPQARKSFAILAAALLFGVGSARVQAQESLNIAVLDMTSALFNSEVAKLETQMVRSETSEDETRVRSIAEQATALNEKLQKDGAVMSADERRKTTEEIEELGVQYEFLVQKIQRLVQERRQAFQEAYTPNLIQAITSVIEEANYDIVFRAEAVLHYNNANDITARVTAKLNEQASATTAQ